MLGVGKTTLANNLTAILGCPIVSESELGLSYIEDLFHNPNRWAFETQLAFLVDKYVQCYQYMIRGENIIVDRSIDEDINIFAQYFYEAGHIDERAYKVYRSLASHITQTFPAPDVIIYCECSLHVIEERIRKRNDGKSILPSNFLKRIEELYLAWIDKQNKENVIIINSETLDFRQQDHVDKVHKYLQQQLT